MGYTCNPRIQEIEAGGSQIQSQRGLPFSKKERQEKGKGREGRLS
jgi:hypothetical protein